MMTRRGLLGLAAAVGLAPRPAAAADDRALFWRIGTPAGRRAIVYGAAPIAAAAAPEIVGDGYRFVPVTHRIAQGFAETAPPDLPDDLPPAWQTLGQPLSDRVRAALVETGLGAEAAAAMPALWVVARLTQEGASRGAPQVADALREAAVEISRPVRTLLSPQDMARLRASVDLRAANAAVDGWALETLLALRKRHGPIGAHLDALYRRRSAAELQAAGLELDVLGGIDPLRRVRTAELRDALWTPLAVALDADYDAFIFLPVETLLGPNGTLARLEGEGCSVTALA